MNIEEQREFVGSKLRGLVVVAMRSNVSGKILYEQLQETAQGVRGNIDQEDAREVDERIKNELEGRGEAENE